MATSLIKQKDSLSGRLNILPMCFRYFRTLLLVCVGVWLMISFIAPPAFCHDAVWPGEKLKTLVPQASSFEQRNLYVSTSQQKFIEEALGGINLPPEDLKPSVYFAVIKEGPNDKPRRSAVILFVDAKGVNGEIETAIVIDTKSRLLQLHIFENSESPTLSSVEFLGQFTGKVYSDAFVLGQDLTMVKGLNPANGQAVASGAKRGMVIVNELFRRR